MGKGVRRAAAGGLLAVGLAAAGGAAVLARAMPDKAPPEKPAAAAPLARAPQAAPSPPPPADELPPVARLRALLGPQLSLRYASARPEGDRVHLAGVELQPVGAGAPLRAAELTLEGVRADGFARAVARGVAVEGAAAADSVEIAGFSALPGPPRPEGFALDRLEVANFRAEGDGNSFRAARLVAEGYGAGREFGLLAEGISTSAGRAAPVGEVTVQRARFAASDMAALLAAAFEGAAAAGGGVGSPPPWPEGWQRLEIEEVSVGAPGGGGGPPLGGYARMELRSDSQAGRAAAFTLRVDELRLAASGPLQSSLESLGYGAGVRADFVLDSSHDEATGRFEIGAAALAVRDVAAIGLSLRLDGVRQSAILQGADQVALVSARLRYADQSLLRRALEAQARERRAPVASVRREWEQAVVAALPEPPRGRGESLAALRDPLLRVIRGQARELEAAVNPPRPLGAEAFAKMPNDPAGWQRLLGLTLTAR